MSYQNYKTCIVPPCTSTTIRTPEKLFIRVPEEIERRNTWLKLSGRDPQSVSKKTRLHICQDHFDLENDMENYLKYKIMGSVKRIIMKRNCRPTKFNTIPTRKCRLKHPQSNPVNRPKMVVREYKSTSNAVIQRDCTETSATSGNLPWIPRRNTFFTEAAEIMDLFEFQEPQLDSMDMYNIKPYSEMDSDNNDRGSS